MFIALEGIDGTGKSTQVKMLAKWLECKGHEVFRTAEPTKNPIGRLIWDILKKHTELDPKAIALLFIADRIEHQKGIKEALNGGKVVVTDRYFWATYAYQGAQGVDVEWLRSLHKDMLNPDLTIILDLDPQMGLDRVKTNEKFEKLEFLEKVRENFLALAKQEGLTVVKSEGSRGQTHKRLIGIVGAALEDG